MKYTTYAEFLAANEITEADVARLRAMTDKGWNLADHMWAEELLKNLAEGYADYRFSLDEFLPTGTYARRRLDAHIRHFADVDYGQELHAAHCEAGGYAPDWL